MRDVGIRELKEHTSEILRRVADGKEIVEITRRGKVIARIVPAGPEDTDAEFARVWADMDEIAKEIGALWPKGVSAVDAVREQRREL